MKKKILVVSDEIRSNSGVGKVTRNIVNNLVDRFDFVCVSAMINHPEAGQRLDISADVNKLMGTTDASVVVYPQSGYGDINLLRHIFAVEKPDAMFLISDPRHFIDNIWNHEYEIRKHVPIYYYNLWDGADGLPLYNLPYYMSVDFLSCINKQTYGNIKQLGLKTPLSYVPHGIDSEVFKPVTVPVDFKAKVAPGSEFTVLYVSRNIRRKHPIDIILAFDKFAAAVNKPVRLVMHTDIIDQNGTNLEAVVKDFGIKAPISFTNQMSDEELNWLYNIADVTINASEAEGFGLGIAESIMAGTPVIATVTGGLADQMFDIPLNVFTKDFHGNNNGTFKTAQPWAYPVFPVSRGFEGSVVTPYVQVDKTSIEDIVEAMFKAFTTDAATRKANGLLGRDFFIKNGFEVKTMATTIGNEMEQMINNNKKPVRFALYSKPVTAPVKAEYLFTADYQKKYEEWKGKFNV